MICPVCRRQTGRNLDFCPTCGAARRGADTTFELVLGDRSRVPLVGELTIGRAPGNALQLADPSVSRVHAKISLHRDGGRPVLEDIDSGRHTWVDGRRLSGPLTLRDGARIALGDEELVVERRRADSEAGHTVVVPPGASIIVPSSGEPQTVGSTRSRLGVHPRLRSGYALKRLEAAEGSRRWVLKDLVSERSVRLSDTDAYLLQLLDGRHAIAELVSEAEQRLGAAGPARLARLLADVSSRGLLAGAGESNVGAASGRFERLLRPRQLRWSGAGDVFERVYLRGAWRLFTPTALGMIAATMAVGAAAFAYLIAARYGTPFVVARKVGLGALVFVVGRLLIAAFHEAAHGLTMASFGRRVGEAGIKLVLIFPYTFVDTSDAWFEPRRRRIAVSAAGPVCDVFLGGSFALACLMAPPGTFRDIFFQLAFGAYYGALFNLNPLLERDGYQVLVDVLGEPALRRRALDQLRRRLAGRGQQSDSRLLDRYAFFALAWMVLLAGTAAVVSLRYEPALAAVLPDPAAWTLLALIWAGLLMPSLSIVLPALGQRWRSRER
jgi:pSer/pThr/pTyr-binding forkhead associated (FHA) protein